MYQIFSKKDIEVDHSNNLLFQQCFFCQLGFRLFSYISYFFILLIEFIEIYLFYQYKSSADKYGTVIFRCHEDN